MGDVFQDEALRQLIETALAENFDVRIAATRILQAEAAYRVTRADQFPTVNGQAQGQGQHGAVIAGQTLPTTGIGAVRRSLVVGARLLGQVPARHARRRAPRSWRTEWGRRAISRAWSARSRTAYFVLRALDLQLEIARRTLASREESLRLTEVRERGGATPLVDVRQAEQLVPRRAARSPTSSGRSSSRRTPSACCSGRNPDPSPADGR